MSKVVFADPLVFASHAAIALAGAQHGQNLRAVVDSRDLIGQAKGILMERFKITADEAFRIPGRRLVADQPQAARDRRSAVCHRRTTEAERRAWTSHRTLSRRMLTHTASASAGRRDVQARQSNNWLPGRSPQESTGIRRAG